MDPQEPVEHGWVKVTNIAPQTTEEEIKNLFGFCGFVNAVQMSTAEDGTKVAIIEFYDKTAVSTAALLTNAIIQDRAIKVELYIATSQEQNALLTTQTDSPKPTGADPVARQSKTAVMAKILAGGYILANDVKGKAIAWDSGNLNLIQKVEAIGHKVTTGAQELNAYYGIAEKGQTVINLATVKAVELGHTIASTQAYQTTAQKAAEFDEKFQISKKANEFIDYAKSTAAKLYDETNKEIATQQQQQAQQSQQQQPPQQPLQQPLQQPQPQQQTPQQPPPPSGSGNLYPSLQ